MWMFSRSESLGGRFQLVVSKLSQGGKSVDVTTFRGVPTSLDSFSNADPFGDSTATFTFPRITMFDDLDSVEIGSWLGDYSNVDLYWVPAQPRNDTLYPNEPPIINALTGLPDVITPLSLVQILDGVRHPIGVARIKVWEGYIASMEFSSDETAANLQIQCQGALFQVDRYLQKPFYPRSPWPLESLIKDCFDHGRKPHLRTQPLKIEWPAGWAKKVPKYAKGTSSVYIPVATPGANWTGYTTRNTGGWDRTLTGFVQDQLAVMLTDATCGVTPGNQWTVQHQRATGLYTPGRQPVLQLRDRFRTPDFDLWVGTPGVEISVTRDTTQANNIIYGDGTGVDGSVWRNAVISNDGSRTDYLPLAASRDIYPANGNPAFSKAQFASEGYNKYGTGFGQDQAQRAAAESLQRDEQPGWAGSITLKTDPSTTLPRWLIRAGMVVRVKGFMGTGDAGFPMHIASVQANPEQGSVQLTVDSRFRDLLSVEEAMVRTRDPLTPSKMLQTGRASVMIEDIQAPWDYTAGSGYVPRPSKGFFDYLPLTDTFPYTDWSTKHPPLHYPSWYVKVNANAPTRKARWTTPVPILTSEKGSIARTEFFVTDVYGRLLKIPFHISIYYINVTVAAMPYDANGPSPFIKGAFESVNPDTGQPWPSTYHLAPNKGMIIGWGHYGQAAGFSPGRESDGGQPTGLLVDESGWTYDNSSQSNMHGGYDPNLLPGKREPNSAISLFASFYAEYSEPVYFMGRLFKQEQGT